jgi:hypothetical protein
LPSRLTLLQYPTGCNVCCTPAACSLEPSHPKPEVNAEWCIGHRWIFVHQAPLLNLDVLIPWVYGIWGFFPCQCAACSLFPPILLCTIANSHVDCSNISICFLFFPHSLDPVKANSNRMLCLMWTNILKILYMKVENVQGLCSHLSPPRFEDPR